MSIALQTGIAVGAVAALGLFVYADRKRRDAPGYAERLRERMLEWRLCSTHSPFT